MGIQRRTGENFILMSEDTYANLQNEIMSLHRRLLGMSQAIDGKGVEYKIGDRSRLSRFKKKNPA